MDNLFSEDDLKDLLKELNKENTTIKVEKNPEMEASEKRYKEIIKKHKAD